MSHEISIEENHVDMMDGVARMIAIIIEAVITTEHPIGRMITTIVRITTTTTIGLEEAMAAAIDAEMKMETTPVEETRATAGITMGTVEVEVMRGAVKIIRETIIMAGLVTADVRKTEILLTIL